MPPRRRAARRGGSYRLESLSGLWAAAPVFGGLSLALFFAGSGLPPFSGFWPKAMLVKAMAHIKAVGRDKAFADFMTKPGPWVDRDLYITVFDMTGKTLAHGANARLVGKDNINMQDANGKYHVKERLEIAKAKGKGQQEFAFLNPMTKQIEAKLMFFERMDDIVVACGSYKPA